MFGQHLQLWLRATCLTGFVALGLTAGPAQSAGFEEEVAAFTSHDGLTIEGILARPTSGNGPFPAILILPGSGAQDADGTIDVPALDITDGRQKIYRAIARYLARRGNVVFRYNKRGISFDHENDQPAIANLATFGDFVKDAESALGLVENRPEVDPNRLAIYGHSQGSQIALQLAATRRDLSLLVLTGTAASSLEDLLEFQLFDLYVEFFRLAADEDGNGFLTLEELDRLDGNLGTGSLWILNQTGLLFGAVPDANGNVSVSEFNPATDENGDGRLHIADEIVPALRKQADDEIALWKSGSLGRVAQTWFDEPPNRKIVQKANAFLLFVVGALDVQTPVSETDVLVARLERRAKKNWERLVLADLGHTLSKPNDFFEENGGLTTLDNPTANPPDKKALRKIWRRARKRL